MTATFDKAFVTLGVDAEEIRSVKGRTAIYLGLMGMAVAATLLVGGVAANLTAPIA